MSHLAINVIITLFLMKINSDDSLMHIPEKLSSLFFFVFLSFISSIFTLLYFSYFKIIMYNAIRTTFHKFILLILHFYLFSIAVIDARINN